MAPYRFHPGISFPAPAVLSWVKDVTRLMWHFISKSCQRGQQLADNIFLSGCANVRSSCESADGKFVHGFAYVKKKREKKGEGLKEPQFLLLACETDSLETNFSEQVAINFS